MGVDVTYAIQVPRIGQEQKETRTEIGLVLAQTPRLATLFEGVDLGLPHDLRPGGSPFGPITTELLAVQSLARFIPPGSDSRHWGYWPMIREQMEALLEAMQNLPSLDLWYLPDDETLESGDDLTLAASRGVAHRVSPALLDEMEQDFRARS